MKDFAGLKISGSIWYCKVYEATLSPSALKLKLKVFQIFEPRHEKTCLREFPTRSDSTGLLSYRS